jgi:hypothetical protein
MCEKLWTLPNNSPRDQAGLPKLIVAATTKYPECPGETLLGEEVSLK